MHCAAPACVAACPAGAVSKREEDGLVCVDESICTGCRKCYETCPFGAPQFGADGLMQKCDMCDAGPQFRDGGAICTLACPTQALVLTASKPL